MTDPKHLAALHARCFTVPRPYTEAEFAALLSLPQVFLCSDPHGFLLGRVIAGEAELLTLAVDPNSRRRGIGRTLLGAYHQKASRRGATESFLEVDETNASALGLYLSDGYLEVGRRPGYYRHADGPASAALVLRRNHLSPFSTPIG